MGSVMEVSVDLPHPALAEADWADAWQTQTVKGFANACEAGDAIVAGFPKITGSLLALRQLLVMPFGLKGAEAGEGFDRVGIFPIVSKTKECVVAGINDRHLDFRIVVDL